MLNRFVDFINIKKLILPGTTTLLAVSGGKDSMVMADLMLKAGYPIHIGHINHHLRGEESEADAKFVEAFCSAHQIPFHLYNIDPYLLAYGNLQEKARQIRYDKLMTWATEFNCAQIATAHHLDDRIESFLMFIMRGTGLTGLSSIAAKNKHIIRPILWATTDEIINYIHEQGITYREDSSNQSDKYLRNQVRHHVIPAMTQADSRALSGLKTTIENMESTSTIFDFLLDKYSETLISYTDDYKMVTLLEIMKSDFAPELLFHLIKTEGFNIYQCRDVIRDLNGQFFSLTHEATVHQNTLIIRKLTEISPFEPTLIAHIPAKVHFRNKQISIEKVNEFPQDVKSTHSFYINAASIQWPITIRTRQDGDSFKPFGMHGKKQKVKDFLINKKISSFDKEEVLILEDQKQILALLPYTIAHEVQIKNQNTDIILIKYI